MPLMLEIALHNPRQHRQFHHAEGPLTLARADAGAPLWMAVDPSLIEQVDALLEIIADDNGISLSTTDCKIEWQGDAERAWIDWKRLPVPAQFLIGDTRFEISESTFEQSASRPLEKLHRDERGRPESKTLTLPGQSTSGPSPKTLTKWFSALSTLNRWTNSLQELYVQAARAAVEAIGLDGAIVVRRRDNEWEIAASHLPHPELGIHCDTTVLDELLKSPETLFQRTESTPPSPLPTPHSDLAPAVVISPIRNAAGTLAGAVYGYRSVRPGNNRRGIRYLEAHLIELLANAVTDGMSRLEHEAESERRRVLLEQLAAGSNDQKSHGHTTQQREVTLLFADLRRFTELSASLDMELASELLGQVMDCFTTAVMDHDGLVVDYYGDGLCAMWNAPADQADHAELACRAALRMVETLPQVAADWAGVLGTDLQLGIGVHTGTVQVGNAGSRHRMKYGPRGTNVHLASRLEKATKEFGVPILVTRTTASRLSNRFHPRSVGTAELTGFKEPIEVFAIEYSHR
ncbi:MAG: adenylate/guanylate cyclase domain-containing protein [Pirellulales bacterium]